MEKTRINVTARDIERGEKFNSHSCPIARAIRRKKPDDPITVGLDCVLINHKYCKIPRIEFFKNWVEAFDGNKPVRPFSFTLYQL